MELMGGKPTLPITDAAQDTAIEAASSMQLAVVEQPNRKRGRGKLQNLNDKARMALGQSVEQGNSALYSTTFLRRRGMIVEKLQEEQVRLSQGGGLGLGSCSRAAQETLAE